MMACKIYALYRVCSLDRLPIIFYEMSHMCTYKLNNLHGITNIIMGDVHGMLGACPYQQDNCMQSGIAA